MALALLISLICALGWGLVDLGYKIGSKYNVGSWMFALTAELFAVVVWGGYFLAYVQELPLLDKGMVPILFVVAFAESIGIVFLANGMKYAVSSAAPIAGSFSVLSPIFAFFIFKESLGGFQILALVCVAVAIYLLSGMKLEKNKGLFWGILTMIFWGASSTLMAIPARSMGEYNSIFWIKTFSLIVIGTVLVLSSKRREQIVKKPFALWKFAFLIGILETVATSAWIIGVAHFSFIQIAIIASLYPVIPVLVIWFFKNIDKEDRPNKKNISGLVFSVLAVLLIILS